MQHQTNSFHPSRLIFLKYLFLISFLVLIFRLYSIQIEAHGRFSAIAEKQHWIGKEIPAKRGEILSSDGYALATNVPAYLVFADPREVKEVELTAGRLVEIIGYESEVKEEDYSVEELKLKLEEERKKHLEEMVELLNQKDLLYIPIAYKQSEEVKLKITEVHLQGIYFEKDYKRSYPEGKMTSHVLGFVGKNDRGEDQGYYGIEGYFNGELKGIAGRVALEKDAVGRPIPVGNYLPVGSDDGRDVVLTISRELQYLIEKKLEEGVKKYDAQDGTVILMEPQTGKILAMASYPNYNPGSWQDWTKDYSGKSGEELSDEEKQMKKYGKKIFPNLGIADVYEPGSIFKPITMSIALEEKKITEETLIESGRFPLAGYTIQTWNDKYFGQSTPAEILQHSDNTAMARVSQLIGIDPFYQYLEQYGFGQDTGIFLEDEDSSWLRSKQEWLNIDLATAAFGQGISVTPIQMMQAYTAFINDGKMVTPYVVEKIITKDTTLELATVKEQQVISPETAKKIVDMLVSVVEKGEFKFAVLPGYKIAGKTGTAQIAVNGVYDAHQTNCTFIGFAPAAEPKFLMLVKLTRPTASTYSAETAVPLWMNIAKELFVYFGVAPQ